MAALPDPQAHAKLQACAVELAAGMVAETEAGDARDDEGYRNDLAWVIDLAVLLLGVTGPRDREPPPAVVQWVTARVNDSHGVLHADGGAAWDRVMASLRRKKDLSGDEVRDLVAQADKASGFAGPLTP